jgi:hypothetical protein
MALQADVSTLRSAIPVRPAGRAFINLPTLHLENFFLSCAYDGAQLTPSVNTNSRLRFLATADTNLDASPTKRKSRLN